MAVGHGEAEFGKGTWTTTFCDLIFLLLGFFVLLYATTAPKVKKPEPQVVESEQVFKVEDDGSETTVIYGAFSPSESPDLSYRGRTAIQAISTHALELGRDLKITIQPLSIGEESDALRLLNQQRMSVVRHIIGFGLPQYAIVMTPLELGISEKNEAVNPSKSLTSRLELTIQPKRS